MTIELSMNDQFMVMGKMTWVIKRDKERERKEDSEEEEYD